jgi:HAD superfamily hydrolase (TIGR01509 family)
MTSLNGWRPDAIIFDMDGLLVDSEPVWHHAETVLIETRGHVYTPELRAQIIGLRLDAIVETYRRTLHFNETTDELVADLISHMLRFIPQMVSPQPGAPELLRWVEAQRLPRAVASSSPAAVIDATLAAQGWDDVFAVRCTADDVAAGKPAPDVYLAAAAQLGIEPARCLALEDSTTGARAAVAAGMVCGAVPDATHTRPEDFEGITPLVFGSLHDVLAALERE